jgi:hypothetical protein
MDELTCHRCNAPAMTRDADGRDWCMRCVADEAAKRRPFAKMAYDALEVLGYYDLAREVRRRQGVIEAAGMQEPIPFEYERMTQ